MITLKEIEKLATLSRLSLTEDEKQGFQKDISSILDYVSQLEKVAVSSNNVPEVGDNYNVLREDVVKTNPGSYTEALLKAAPEREGAYVKVKKIL
jgi:aspartyl-tRNA(Asn)/glutamyl-tRNA(Gln) amidotransferase subunit C